MLVKEKTSERSGREVQVILVMMGSDLGAIKVQKHGDQAFSST